MLLLHHDFQKPIPLGDSVPRLSSPKPVSIFSKSTKSELTLPQGFLSGDIQKQLVEVHVCLVLQGQQNTGITTLVLKHHEF